MIAYRRDWLDAIQIRETADYWADQGLISDEREQEIVAQYPVGFYSPNWFVRIGLALFGAVIIMALEGLLFLIFDAGLGSEVALLGLVIGIGLFVVLEFGLIDKAKHYRSGLDDITLYFGLGMVLFGVSQLFLEGLPFEVHLLCWCLFSGLAALRYADILLTLAAFACLIAFVMSLIQRMFGAQSAWLLPWVNMLIAVGAYWLARKGQARMECRFWNLPLLWIEAAALALFYASGNFWVIQVFSMEMFTMERVPLQPLFWALTFLIPAAYLFFGLKRKDRLMLDIGFFCVVAAIATFRYYFHVIAVEWAVTIAGALLLAIAWWSIQYLKGGQAPTGYTYARDGRDTQIQGLQSQFIEEAFTNTPKIK